MPSSPMCRDKEGWMDRRQARMERIDAMPYDLRMLVKEEGLTIVQAFLDCGVTKSNHIKHLIATVRSGSFNGGVNPLQREKAKP